MAMRATNLPGILTWVLMLAGLGACGGDETSPGDAGVTFESPAAEAGFDESRAGDGVWLVRTDADVIHKRKGWFALSPRCVHCTAKPAWYVTKREIVCPNCRSTYSEHGVYRHGPAKKSLRRLALSRREGGAITVQPGTTFGYEEAEWIRDGSFVKVK